MIFFLWIASPLIYDLQAVVIHSGGPFGGHYHCIAREAGNHNTIFLFVYFAKIDDEMVCVVFVG